MSISRHTILDTDIYCLTGEQFSRGRSNIEVVQNMLDSGIRLIQYREKKKKMGAKLEECRAIRDMTRATGAAFIVNDDIDLAMLVHADGVHIGQEDLPIEAVRELVGPDMAIGLSTHSPEQAQDAVRRGADYIGVGPIFPTQTKEDVCAAVGLDYLDWVVKNIALPFVAIGGIKEKNISQVVQHGAHCVALVTEIVGAADITQKIHDIRQIVAQTKERRT